MYYNNFTLKSHHLHYSGQVGKKTFDKKFIDINFALKICDMYRDHFTLPYF